MNWNRVLVGGGALVAVAVVGVLATSPFKRKVELYHPDDSNPCVQTWPPKPIIHKTPTAKKSKVKWVVHKENKKDYYWEIKVKTGYTDYLGPVDPIECGKKNTSSKSVKKKDVGGGELDWPYDVLVYECSGKTKGAYICTQDPIIWIQD